MRFVSIKTMEQADLQALHRTRSLLVKHRTAVINQIRGLLAEYGLVIAQSPEKVGPAVVRFLDDVESGLAAFARETFSELYEQLRDLESRIERVTHRVEGVYRAHPVCRKLAAVPGIGPLTATALLATVGRPQVFHNGRYLAAWSAPSPFFPSVVAQIGLRRMGSGCEGWTAGSFIGPVPCMQLSCLFNWFGLTNEKNQTNQQTRETRETR